MSDTADTQNTSAQHTTATDSPTSGESRRTNRTVALVTTILGGVVVVGLVIPAVASTLAYAVRSNDNAGGGTLSTPATGITDIRLSVGAGELRVEYADVPEASVDVLEGSADDWALERRGGELVVKSRESRLWGCSFGCFNSDDSAAVLQLPHDLSERGIDLAASLSAGELFVDGEFGEVDLDVSAGYAEVSGSARSFDVDMSAGELVAAMGDVTEAGIELTAGTATMVLTGSAPSEVDVSVTAGDLTLTVPDTTYRVDTDATAGTIENGLRTSRTASRVVSVDITAGNVVLRPGSAE